MPETRTYEEMTVEELKDELADRQLPTSGAKAELITRLEDADAAEPDADVEDEEAGADEAGDEVEDEAKPKAPPPKTDTSTWGSYRDPRAVVRAIQDGDYMVVQDEKGKFAVETHEEFSKRGLVWISPNKSDVLG